MIDSILTQLTTVVDGEVTTRSRVVDGLLDLRNAAVTSSRPDLVAHLDALLKDLPGITTVANGWWLDRLAELRTMVDKPLSSV